MNTQPCPTPPARPGSLRYWREGVALLALPAPCLAGGGTVVGENLLWLALILLAARMFAPLTQRIGFPAVLGELLLGVLLGNLGLVGIRFFEAIPADPIISFLAELGVIVLLLQIGLETRLSDLARAGTRATLVALIGIAAPFALGALVVGPLLLPGLESGSYLFLGAALAATSVGITGRVFRDLGHLGTPAANVVLGAAVIDDVLGLVILAVVTGFVQSGSVSLVDVLRIVGVAVAFLAGSVLLGRWLARRSGRWLARLDAGPSMLFAQVVATGLALAWLAHSIGLAPIIGAFAAGLLFEPAFLKDFETPHIVREVENVLGARDAGLAARLRPVLTRHTGHQHEQLIEPIGYFFVPVFFVLTGMQVDLSSLADPRVAAIALGITLAAIVGKLASGLAAGNTGRWLVGWGMVPRGEVGLIFAMVGRQLGVVTDTLFSVIVIMVILTTLITPPVLTRLLRQHGASPR